LLEALRHEERKLAEESQALEVAWKNTWESVAFEPLTPDLMLDWLAVRAEILEAVERRAMAERQLSALRRDEAEAKKHILAELATLAVDVAPLQDRSLRLSLKPLPPYRRVTRQTKSTDANLKISFYDCSYPTFSR
jgi:predicted nucleic acid-binding protein